MMEESVSRVQLKKPTPLKFILALMIALFLDGIDLLGFGFIPFIDDVIGMILLAPLIGKGVLFMIPEFIPGVELLPINTMAVLLTYVLGE